MELRLLLLFFASGFSSLIYQIAWIKLFSLSFGNTIYAVSTVIAAFMLGLSLGSLVFGGIADKAEKDLKLFGFMEGGIGLSALAITLFFPALDSAYVTLHHQFSLTPEGSTLLRFFSTICILIVPTMLMGGTLPVLTRCLVTRINLAGPEISRLYGINTLGACLGCFLTGYLFFSLLGVKATTYLGVAISLSVSAMAFASNQGFSAFISSQSEPEDAAAKPAKPDKKKSKKPTGKKAVSIPSKGTEETLATEGAGSSAPLLLFSLIAGLCGLSYEILWTKSFAIIFKSTTYLFSNILTVFLLGIAIGSLAYKKFFDKHESPLHLFGLIQLAIGAYALFSILIFWWMPGEIGQEGQWAGAASWGDHILKLFGWNCLAMIIPTFLMGVAFPLINKVYIASIKEVGQRAGSIYGMNVMGGILGSLLSGFFLIPWVGLQGGIMLIALLNILLGVWAVIQSGVRKGFGAAGYGLSLASFILFTMVLVGEADIGAGPDMGGEVLFKKEGVAGTVRVIKEKGGKGLTLSVNNYMLATTGDVAVRFGHIPLLFHPSPREVLTISLGAGITAGAVGRHEEVERVDCVEIVPEMEEAAAFFKESNHSILSNPKLNLTTWDGRNFVQTTKNRYDVIISDLFQPDSSGVGNLYTQEHYAHCLEKLKAGGLMAQWLPLYQLHPEDLKTIVATFASVFPKINLWYGDTNAAKPTLLLLGSRETLRVDPDQLAAKLKKKLLHKDLIEWDDVYGFLSFYINDGEGIGEFIRDVRINTDEHPVIEYSAPKHIWNRPANAIKNFEELAKLRSVFSHFDTEIPVEKRSAMEEKANLYFQSRAHLLRGRVAHAKGDIKQEILSYEKSESINTNDPYLGFSCFELGYLYLQQGRGGEALHFLEKAVSISPHLPEAHYFLSKVYGQMGEKEKAEREYKRAMEGLQ